MNKVYIDFGTNIRFMLLRDNRIVQFVTLDYKKATLSELHSLMFGKRVEEITYCLPSHFSTTLLEESVALEHSKLESSDGFFCVSLEDVSKLRHLAQSLQIGTVLCTERRFMCHADGIYVFEYDNIFQIYSFVKGRLISYDVAVDELLKAVVQRNCIRYSSDNIVNMVNQTDFSLLCDLFENVFSVTDNDTLADLTYMAYLSKARAFDVSEYINSQYNSISIVTDSYSDDTDNADVSAGADAEMDSDNNKPPEKEVPKAITSRKQKPRKLEKDESEDLLKVHRHKSPLPIALALAGALAANGYFYYAQSQVTKQRKNAEEEFQQLLQSVSTLQSKYTVLSAQSTAEAGAAAYSLLEAVGLTTSREDITLHSFTINGSTVYITVSAESEDLFWNFYNEISEAYNVSGVADGTLPDDTATYTISMVL